jgi:hypothetical protein
MEHLKALLSTSSAGQTATLSPTEWTQCLHATLLLVARPVRSNSVDTLSRKSNKRAASPSPLSHSATLPPKRRCSMVTLPTNSVFLPMLRLSTFSSLTHSSQGGTNQAIHDVLYGDDTQSSNDISFHPALSTWNLGLCRLLVPDVLQLNEEDKIVLVLSSTSQLLPLYKGAILQEMPSTVQRCYK